MDIDGRCWTMIDKASIFGERVTRESLPADGAIRCVVLRHDEAVADIDVSAPDGLDAGGVTVFRVPLSAVLLTP